MSSDATGSRGLPFTFSNFCNVVHGKMDDNEHVNVYDKVDVNENDNEDDDNNTGNDGRPEPRRRKVLGM